MYNKNKIKKERNLKMMFPNQQSENNFFNLVNILAFALGYENLQENRAQSKYNDVHSANDKQAEFLLTEIDRRFQEQNKTLEKQNEMLESLLEAIKKNE